MSAFLGSLCLEVMVDADGHALHNRSGRTLFILTQPFAYQSDVVATYRNCAPGDERSIIRIKVGFITDLASQPQITLSIFGEIGQRPSLPHDYIYSTGEIPRGVADDMLEEAMLLDGEPEWKAASFYLGTHLFGGSHFDILPALKDGDS
jgi:hypothetical protein